MPTSASLSEMVDLALGTPEVGCVNYTILHRFLHSVLYQLHIGNVRADLPEEDEKEFLSSVPKGDGEGDQRRTKREVIIVTENASTCDGEESGTTEEKGRPWGYALSEADSGVTGLTGVTSGMETTEGYRQKEATTDESRPIPIIRSPYHQLEEKVERLESLLRNLENLPSNRELWEKAGSDAMDVEGKRLRPVAEMWQSMQLSRKVDANTQGVSKLMSLVEDLMLEIQSLKQAEVERCKNDQLLQNLLQLATQMDQKVKELDERVPTEEVLDGFVTWMSLEDSLKGLKQQFDQSSIPQFESMSDSQFQQMSVPQTSVPQFGQMPGAQHSETQQNMIPSYKETGQSLTQLNAQMSSQVNAQMNSQVNAQLSSRMSVHEAPKTVDEILAQAVAAENEIESSKDSQSRPMSRRRSRRISTPGPSLELQDLLEGLGKLNERHDLLETRVDLIEVELAKKGDLDMLRALGFNEGLVDQIQKMLQDIDTMKDMQTQDTDYLQKLQKLTDKFQVDLEQLSSNLINLSEDSLKHNNFLEDLFNNCRDLEERKADKEFVLNEMNLKADKENLEEKVNNSQFEAACDEINQMINDIINKLTDSQGEWKNAMDQINSDLDGKLDRLEFSPFRDELEKQLRALAKKIAALQANMGAMGNLDEAAGIRKQLVQRFHCISCDRPVDLMPQKAVPSLPAVPGLPETRTNRPYVVYELDQVRQQKRNYGWAPQYTEVVDLYATQRACGGSHTLTYPHRRLVRSSNNGPGVYADEPPPHHPPPPYRIDTDGNLSRGGRNISTAGGGGNTRLPNVNPLSSRTTGKPSRSYGDQGRPQSPQPIRPTSAQLALRPVSSRNEGLVRSKTIVPTSDEQYSCRSPVPPSGPKPGIFSDQMAEVRVPLSHMVTDGGPTNNTSAFQEIARDGNAMVDEVEN